MATEYITRMGDGRKVTMTKEEILADIEAGMGEAVDSAEVPELSGDEIDHLVEIVASKEKLVTVEHGKEVILSLDGGSISIESEHGSGIPCGRINGVEMIERGYCLDILELGHMDYSYKPVKPLTAVECQTMRQLQEFTTAPLLYGAMPNMGLYYTPDGPYENPGDLMKAFKIREAQESIEKSAEHLTRDMIWTLQKMMKNGGADGANFDTTAAAGDGDFYATLLAIEALRKEFPEMYIEAGMASETVLGIHGDLKYDGVNVAGLWPHKQIELMEKAGVNVFGPVCNTNTTYSFAWNLARAVTVVKACSEVATIPIHVNMGNGVGGIPMFEIPSTDTISRADKAMIEIANVDGIQAGSGDAFAMYGVHSAVAGMNGMRTAGDLVARMQFAKSMRLPEAKEYVAQKLDVDVMDLADECMMREIREDLGLCTMTENIATPRGIAAKMNIEKVLDLKINSCELFRNLSSII